VWLWPTDVQGTFNGGGNLAAVANELARRLTSDGDALSSTIAAQGMRRVMLEVGLTHYGVRG